MEYRKLLQTDLYSAMKQNDNLRKRVIRLLLSSIELAEIAKGESLSDFEYIAMVQKEIKTKNDTIVDAQKANRSEMVAEAQEEIKVLEAYLPQQLSEAELIEMVAAVVTDLQASSLKDMGEVMKVLLPKLAGRASNQDASRAVKDCLLKS